MLLAMSVDERLHVRELAFRRVLKARTQPSKGKTVRTFVIPTINFNAADYTELIDWSSCKLTSPPAMDKVQTEDIEAILSTKALPDFQCLNFPCHTQAVERCVKLVTESSGKVCGHDNRDGFIRSTLLSRSKMQMFDQKSHFKLMS